MSIHLQFTKYLYLCLRNLLNYCLVVRRAPPILPWALVDLLSQAKIKANISQPFSPVFPPSFSPLLLVHLLLRLPLRWLLRIWSIDCSLFIFRHFGRRRRFLAPLRLLLHQGEAEIQKRLVDLTKNVVILSLIRKYHRFLPTDRFSVRGFMMFAEIMWGDIHGMAKRTPARRTAAPQRNPPNMATWQNILDFRG